MTLICCAKLLLRNGPALLLATDSMLSAGHRWPSGPKLFPIVGRDDSAIAFEGDTELAYPLLFNAMNFIRYSDHLKSTHQTDAGSVAMRMRTDMDAAFQGLLADRYFNRGHWKCSYVFAAWTRMGPEAWCLYDDGTTGMKLVALDDPARGDPLWTKYGCYFAGNGDHDPVARAEEALHRADPKDANRVYRAFLEVIEDPAESAVGGMPQVALVYQGRCEVVGIEHDGHRYLLGHRVASGAKNVRFCQKDLRDLEAASL